MTFSDEQKTDWDSARAASICSPSVAGFERGSWSLADSALILALLCFLFPSTGAMADAFASKHRAEIKQMVAAGIRLQEELPRYVPSLMPGEPGSPGYKSPGEVRSDCYWFVHARFYSRFRDVVDNLDTSPFKETRDFEEDMEKESVLRDPRKIVLANRERIYNLWRHEGTEGSSAGDFAADYARRPDLENECGGYLDATGLR